MLFSPSESKCYSAEFIGTFTIVLIGCGAFATTPEGPTKSVAVNLAFGLAVTVMICALGHVSKAHFNPAVTLAFCVSRQFPLRCAIGYWLAQGAGAIAAALMISQISTAANGATVPSVQPVTAILIEALLTFLLMFVICSVSKDRRAPSHLSGPVIGGVVLMSGLFAGPLTGNSLNPARSLGPALFAPTALPYLWIYIVGPCLGAMAAVMFHSWLAKDYMHPVCLESCC